MSTSRRCTAGSTRAAEVCGKAKGAAAFAARRPLCLTCLMERQFGAGTTGTTVAVVAGAVLAFAFVAASNRSPCV